MEVAFSLPDIGDDEIKEVVETLRSGWITTGPKTKEFERQIASYCNTGKAVCLNSATACMENTLRILNIGPGDEIITTAYTYTATASVICHVGAKVVLADTGDNSYEMDYDKVEQSVNERTKAIIAVDLAGKMCNYSRLIQIAEDKKQLFHPAGDIQEAIGRIAVIADAAHAIGAYNIDSSGAKKMCGDAADFTSFSFHAVKNLTTAEGGAVVWKHIEGIRDEDIYRQFMLLSLHGQTKDALTKNQKGSWEYDIVAPYYKCNMTDIMAAIGTAQLRRYSQILERRKEIIDLYNEGLRNENLQILDHFGDRFGSSGHLYMVRLTGRNEKFRNAVISRMADKGVRCNVHYKPLPMLTAYKNMGFHIDQYPNAYYMYQNEITLPLHTRLTDDEVQYAIAAFKDSMKKD